MIKIPQLKDRDDQIGYKSKTKLQAVVKKALDENRRVNVMEEDILHKDQAKAGWPAPVSRIQNKKYYQS